MTTAAIAHRQHSYCLSHMGDHGYLAVGEPMSSLVPNMSAMELQNGRKVPAYKQQQEHPE